MGGWFCDVALEGFEEGGRVPERMMRMSPNFISTPSHSATARRCESGILPALKASWDRSFCVCRQDS